MATNLNSNSFILAFIFTRKKFPGFLCPPLGLIVVFRGDRCIKRCPCNMRRHINSACKLDVFLSKVISNGESLYAKESKSYPLGCVSSYSGSSKPWLAFWATRVAYIHGAVMTGISLRLAWHSFRPSPLGVQGDIALSVLGWVDAKFTPIDMSSLVEPPNANPTPLVSSWFTLHRACLVSLLCLFGRFNSVSISAVSVAVAFSPSYCHVHNIPRLLVRASDSLGGMPSWIRGG